MRCTVSSWISSFSVFALILSTVGCSTIRYQITLKPDGDAIERTVVCWQESNTASRSVEAFSTDRLKEVAKAYGAELPKKTKQKHTFKGHFVGEMPNDLNNSGTFTKWHSSFGTLSAYSERFDGTDDIVAQIKSLERGADRVTDFILAWLDSELANEPRWKELRPVIDTKVRRDLANLCHILLLAVGGVDVGEVDAILDNSNKSDRAEFFKFLNGILIRLTQYLVDRGYIEVADIPTVLRSFGAENQFTDQSLHSLIQKWIKKQLKMDPATSLPPSFDFLASRRSIAESFKRFLSTTPEYKKEMQERVIKEPGQNKEDQIDRGIVIGHIIASDESLLRDMGLTLMPLKNGRQIEVKLACSVRPMTTNGRWNEKEGEIDWNTYKQGSFGLSPMMEAVWAEPNSEEQLRRFGGVILTESNLGAYVIWYAGLSKEEMKEWDAFVNTWTPGPELIRSIESFRFSFDPPVGRTPGGSESLDDIPRKFLIEALKKQRDRKK